MIDMIQSSPENLIKRRNRFMEGLIIFVLAYMAASLPQYYSSKSSCQQKHVDLLGKEQLEASSISPPHKMIEGEARYPESRTLVVLTGNLRGGELAWESLYKEVLDNNPNTDLALLIGDAIHNYPNASLFQRAKYVWRVPEFDDWADAIDLIDHGRQNWREHVLDVYNRGEDDSKEMGNILLGAADNIKGSGAIVFMHRWFLTQHLLVDNLWRQYTHFFVTRSDQYYLCGLNFTDFTKDYDSRTVWVPQGEDYGGYCDRAFFCSSENILPALNILPPLIHHPEDYLDVLTSDHYNTESFLKRRWDEQSLKVRRFPRMMFTCATDHDGTRWREHSRQYVEGGIHWKYKSEYKRSVFTCRGMEGYVETFGDGTNYFH